LQINKEKMPGSGFIKFWITAILSTLGGMAIAIIDSQPNWNDSGITAGLLFIVSGIAGFVNPKRFWLWALLTGIWIPVAAITRNGDVTMFIVMIFTFGGSFSGKLIRRMVSKEKI
jgi:hypothetical protein